jgi:hypothetical protein
MLYSECNAQYNYEYDALLRCMIVLIVQHEDEGSHA